MATSGLTKRSVPLPGRGTTFVREAAGPPGAPTLVLLHGLAATGGLNWRPSLEPLSERFRVVAIDHRGHGRGIPVRGHFRLADCADDVFALADREPTPGRYFVSAFGGSLISNVVEVEVPA